MIKLFGLLKIITFTSFLWTTGNTLQQGSSLPMSRSSEYRIGKLQAEQSLMDMSKKILQHKGYRLVEVSLLSIGIVLKDNLVYKIIPKNSKLPASNSAMFTTSKDGQNKIIIPLYQGEESIAKNDNVIGNLLIDGLPELERGKLHVKVTINIEESGITQAIAEELITGAMAHQLFLSIAFKNQTDYQKLENSKQNDSEEAERIWIRHRLKAKLYSWRNEILSKEKLTTFEVKVLQHILSTLSKDLTQLPVKNLVDMENELLFLKMH